MDSCCLCKHCSKLLNLYGIRLNNGSGDVECAHCEFPAVDLEMVTKAEYYKALEIYKRKVNRI